MTKPAIQPAAPTAPWYAINARANRHAEVFIFGDIGDGWADETVTARKFVAEIAALSVDTMTVRINSVGGSVPDGLAIYNALRRYPARVSTVVESVAASIASLIAMAGETVSMAENAMLISMRPGRPRKATPTTCAKWPDCSTSSPPRWPVPTCAPEASTMPPRWPC